MALLDEGSGSQRSRMEKPAPFSPDWVHEVVSYHQPNEAGLLAIGAIRVATVDMVNAIIRNCPPCADRTAAIRKVREGMNAANSAIALQGLV